MTQTPPQQPVPGGIEEGWTTLQEAYIQKLMATYQANLFFLQKNFPRVFEKIMGRELPAPFTVGPNAEMTIYSGRHHGDAKDHVELGKILMSVFDNPKTRPRIVVDTAYLNDLYNVAPHQDIPYFHTYIEKEYRTELVQTFMDMTAGEGERLTLADFGDKKLPIAIVFGSGYGWHLDRLVDDYEMRHLFIVDTDIARLNLSLYLVDYVLLAQRFARTGFHFSMACDEDPDILADQLRHVIYNNWPPYYVQGAGLFFNDYDSEKVRTLWGTLQRDLWTLYRGWGFLDDEIVGLKQAVENGVDHPPAFTRAPLDMPQDSVAVVIGAGPSLDTLVPLLKANRERMVVFSCGSAVTALAREGIKPDFHVEIERTLLTCRFLEDPVTKAFIADVPIIALTIMHPDVFELTTTPLVFFKETDLGTAVGDFFNEYPHFRSGPTCTNGGVGLALKLGFSKIFLAGVDFGFRDEKRHHAKSSIYYDEEVEIDPGLMKYVDNVHAEHKEDTARTVEANFGGDMLSTEIFMHSRDSMAMTIKEHPGPQVFNLNDGALIKGAQPLKPEDFHIDATPATKQATLAAVMTAFTQDYSRDPLENLSMLEVQLKAVREDLTRIVNGEFRDDPELKTKMDVVDRLYDIHYYFFQAKHQSTQIFPLMRGSMLHMGRFFYDCVSLCATDEKATEFGRFGFDLMLRFIDAASAALAQLHEVGAERKEYNKGRQKVAAN